MGVGVGTVDDRGYVIPPRFWAWAGTRRAVRVFLWLFALGVGAHHLWHARNWLADGPDTPTHRRRPDPGGHGHTQIDFGGQWVMGRMLVLGHGRDLYHRQRQWEVVREGYPVSAETPVQREETLVPRHLRQLARSDDDVGHDADRLMSWFMGADPPQPWKTVGGAAAAPLAAGPFGGPFAAVALHQAAAQSVTSDVAAEVSAPAVGGPLYPPVHAFFYAPLGLFDHPHDAYALFQVIAVGLAYVAGLGVNVLTRGRVWWSVASAGVLLYPGCRSGLDLGQNPTLSLCIALWGWVLAARGREWAGGAVWGIFAFKPVWGMAFFLVPLLAGRWRVCLAMVGTGAVLGALTLPVVGVQTWFDWLAVGKEAAGVYNESLNWINLSRDLQGIPRRFLLDFTRPEAERDTPQARAVAWGLWGVVFGTTVLVYRVWANRRKPIGLGAGFLFLGAFLTCYRFMYYDVLLSLVGVVCLLAEPGRFFRTRVFGVDLTPQVPMPARSLDRPAAAADPFGPKLVGYVSSVPLTLLAGLYLVENVLTGLAVEATVGVIGWGHPTTAADGATAMTTPRMHADTSIAYPWDTVLVIALWAWCGLQLILRGERSEGQPDDPGRVTPGEPAGGRPPG
ncbi:MAG: hypothetical protein JWO38_8089 [Gemmataceae bacterium]|nr:hypothetical protein [Gemmataceae bacterium]